MIYTDSKITADTPPDQAPDMYSTMLQEVSSENFQNVPMLFLLEFFMGNLHVFCDSAIYKILLVFLYRLFKELLLGSLKKFHKGFLLSDFFFSSGISQQVAFLP